MPVAYGTEVITTNQIQELIQVLYFASFYSFFITLLFVTYPVKKGERIPMVFAIVDVIAIKVPAQLGESSI